MRMYVERATHTHSARRVDLRALCGTLDVVFDGSLKHRNLSHSPTAQRERQRGTEPGPHGSAKLAHLTEEKMQPRHDNLFFWGGKGAGRVSPTFTES